MVGVSQIFKVSHDRVRHLVSVEVFKVHAQDRSTSHPRQFSNNQRQWWRKSDPRQQCFKRQRLLWSTSHPRQQCFLVHILTDKLVLFQDSAQQRFLEQNITFKLGFPPGQRSTAFGGAHHHGNDGFLPVHSSAAFRGAEHHDLQGSVPGQSSTARRGVDLHGLLQDAVEKNRSVVLFSQRSNLCDEGGWRRARALRGSGVAEVEQLSSGEVRFLFWDASKEDVLCQCEVGQHSLPFSSSRKGVRWRTFEFTLDDPKAAHLMVVFASEEVALQFKDAFEAAQAAMLVARGLSGFRPSLAL